MLSCAQLLSRVRLCYPMDCTPAESMGFSKQEFWSELPCPPPGDLPNPRIEPRSPTLQADALPSDPQGSPRILEWVAHPFFRGSSRPRSQASVSCPAGGFFTSCPCPSSFAPPSDVTASWPAREEDLPCSDHSCHGLLCGGLLLLSPVLTGMLQLFSAILCRETWRRAGGPGLGKISFYLWIKCLIKRKVAESWVIFFIFIIYIILLGVITVSKSEDIHWKNLN